MGGKNVKNTMIGKVLDILAPHPCFGCEKIGKILCERCEHDIENEPLTVCRDCFSPLTDGCRCDTGKAWVVGWRTGVLKRIIDAYKFERVRQAVYPLALLLDTRLPLLPAETVIVPVPTRPAHIRQRGYDHLLLLAREVARLRDLEIHQAVGTSMRKAQHFLTKSERSQQTADGFFLTKNLDTTRPYLILDDIITTGATLRAMTGLLQTAGAQTVWIAALARQPLDE